MIRFISQKGFKMSFYR